MKEMTKAAANKDLGNCIDAYFWSDVSQNGGYKGLKQSLLEPNGPKILTQIVKCCWVWTHCVCVGLHSPLVSPRAAEWRGGAEPCCTVQLLTSDWSPSPPFISQLVPREDGCVPPCSGPVKVSKRRMRSYSGRAIGNRSVFGRRWCLQVVTAEISPTCRRVDRQTTALLLVRSWRGRMDTQMVAFSGWKNCFGRFSSHTETANCHKVAQVKTGLID